MGLWPFSNSSGDANAQAQQPPPSTSSRIDSIPSTPAQTAPQPAASISVTSAPHDPDFYAAHPHLAPSNFFTTPVPTNSSSDTTSATAEVDPDYDPSLPRHMSCRAAFDSAFYCSSLGGHFNDLYRYGQLRSCSDHWNDFWFCMRTKNSYSGQDVKERMIQDRYREKDDKLRSGPNSEDVWARRGPGEEVRGAFGVVAEKERR